MKFGCRPLRFWKRWRSVMTDVSAMQLTQVNTMLATVRWMHRVRLYPTCAQARRLTFMLDVTRRLYNAALQQRSDAFRLRRLSVTLKMQYAELTSLRPEDPALRSIYRECEDAVLRRLHLAFQAFFRRCRDGETPGFPRYKSASRWSQLEFPHGDRALNLDVDQRRLRVPGVGSIALRKGRCVPKYGRAFLVVKNSRWYAVFECSRDPVPMASTGRSVGVDRGVRVLAATSEGRLIPNPRHADRLRSRVELHARALAAATVRDKIGRVVNRGDKLRVKALRRLARAKEREANARRDNAHKVALDLIRRYDLIAIERLSVRNMTRSARGSASEPGRNVAAKTALNRALLDAGFGMLGTLIREKAAWAARVVISVNPKYTSQTCAECGRVAKESRHGARFICVHCGHDADADTNAARIILARAVQSAPMSELLPGSARFLRHGAA
jgi:putative transposase